MWFMLYLQINLFVHFWRDVIQVLDTDFFVFLIYTLSYKFVAFTYSVCRDMHFELVLFILFNTIKNEITVISLVHVFVWLVSKMYKNHQHCIHTKLVFKIN